MQDGRPDQPAARLLGALEAAARRLHPHRRLRAPPTTWFARDLRLRKGMTASLSGTLATMGPGVPVRDRRQVRVPRSAGDRVRRRRRDADERHERADHGRQVPASAGATSGSSCCVFNNRDLNHGHLGAARARGRPDVPRDASRSPTSRPRATRSWSGCTAIASSDPDDLAAAWERGARAPDKPGRARGGRRPARSRRCRRTSPGADEEDRPRRWSRATPRRSESMEKSLRAKVEELLPGR